VLRVWERWGTYEGVEGVKCKVVYIGKGVRVGDRFGCAYVCRCRKCAGLCMGSVA
jgi:hypothetical protein